MSLVSSMSLHKHCLRVVNGARSRRHPTPPSALSMFARFKRKSVRADLVNQLLLVFHAETCKTSSARHFLKRIFHQTLRYRNSTLGKITTTLAETSRTMINLSPSRTTRFALNIRQKVLFSATFQASLVVSLPTVLMS